MSNESWILLGVHFIIFLIVRWRLGIKKRKLELDNAHLTIENEKLAGEVNYYQRQLSKK